MAPKKMIVPVIIFTSGILINLFISLSQPNIVLANSHQEYPQKSQIESTNRESNSLNNRYPEEILQWRALIEKYSAENQIDPNLIAAVILIESAGNLDAYSSSGAVGLMQVMPRDGISASFQCGVNPCFSNRPGMQELFDPEFNIAFGTKFLASLINRKENTRDALKAYGPMDVGYGYADKVLSIYYDYQDL